MATAPLSIARREYSIGRYSSRKPTGRCEGRGVPQVAAYARVNKLTHATPVGWGVPRVVEHARVNELTHATPAGWGIQGRTRGRRRDGISRRMRRGADVSGGRGPDPTRGPERERKMRGKGAIMQAAVRGAEFAGRM
jgi:hypothetical protein